MINNPLNGPWMLGPKIKDGEFAGLHHIFAKNARGCPDEGSTVIAQGVTHEVGTYIINKHQNGGVA